MHVMVDMSASEPGCNGRLWLGGEMASTNPALLQDNGISVVLPASRKPAPAESLNHVILEYVDGTGLANEDYSLLKFLAVVDEVVDMLKAGHGVLSCCRNGAHRSATETAVMIMRMSGCSSAKAEAYVSTLRNCVDLNSTAPPSSHRRRPVKPSDFLMKHEATILNVHHNLQINDIVTPVAFRKKMMDLGFESVSTKPKAKAIRRDAGYSSFELVTDPASASASGSEPVKVDAAKGKAAEDVLGGTTLSSEGGSLTSSSAASGRVPEPKPPPAYSQSLGKRKEHAESDTDDFQVVQDELDTKEKRVLKLNSLCKDLQNLNVSMLKLLQPKESPRPEAKAMPKPPSAMSNPAGKGENMETDKEEKVVINLETDKGAASPAKVEAADASGFSAIY